MIYYPTVMVRYSLFVLKVPLNPKQTNKHIDYQRSLDCVAWRGVSVCLAEKQLYEVHRQERQLELSERRHQYQWSTSTSPCAARLRDDALPLPRLIQVQCMPLQETLHATHCHCLVSFRYHHHALPLPRLIQVSSLTAAASSHSGIITHCRCLVSFRYHHHSLPLPRLIQVS